MKAGDVCGDISGRRTRQLGDQAAAAPEGRRCQRPVSDWALNALLREGQREVKVKVGGQLAGSFSPRRLQKGK